MSQEGRGKVGWGDSDSEGVVSWTALSLLFALLQEGSGEMKGQRENLLSSKLAAGETLKVAGMCQAALRLEGHGTELGSLGPKSGHENEDSGADKSVRGLRGDY